MSKNHDRNMILIVLVFIIAIVVIVYFLKPDLFGFLQQGNQGNQGQGNQLITVKDSCDDFNIYQEFVARLGIALIDSSRIACQNLGGIYYTAPNNVGCWFPPTSTFKCNTVMANPNMIYVSQICSQQLFATWECNELKAYLGCYCNFNVANWPSQQPPQEEAPCTLTIPSQASDCNGRDCTTGTCTYRPATLTTVASCYCADGTPDEQPVYPCDSTTVPQGTGDAGGYCSAILGCPPNRPYCDNYLDLFSVGTHKCGCTATFFCQLDYVYPDTSVCECQPGTHREYVGLYDFKCVSY